MKLKLMSGIINRVQDLTETPNRFLHGDEDFDAEMKGIMKRLYDLNKYHDSDPDDVVTINELLIEDFDDEQIWQQLDLKNGIVYDKGISDIAYFLIQACDLNLIGKEEENQTPKREEKEDTKYNEYQWDDFDEIGEDGVVSSSNVELDKDNLIVENDTDSEAEETSVVDDKFFKLKKMEKFLEKEENENHVDTKDESIDYFEDLKSDDGNEGLHYDDFFDKPQDELVKEKKKENSGHGPLKKKIKVGFDSIGNTGTGVKNGNDDGVFDDGPSTSKMNSNELSGFEASEKRLQTRIKSLEEEALMEKPWQLKGEVSASSRPQNSLLEECVEFDTAVRPPPVMTDKATLKLEDLIIQRINVKAWDDVERKVKPVENPQEFRKRLVMDQEKSKLSLAEIYEQDYLRKKQALMQMKMEKPEEKPAEHSQIENMEKSLYTKLDGLSNYHFTPKTVTTEVNVVSKLPAATVEEVAPTTTSDADLLAPEEIEPKMKGDLVGKTERTDTDKKRERRIKKEKQKMMKKENEKKIALNLAEGKDMNEKNKEQKEKSKKLGQNVSLAEANGDDKHVKSSSAFFTKLHDDVQSHIKSKSEEIKSPNASAKLDVKKLKL